MQRSLVARHALLLRGLRRLRVFRTAAASAVFLAATLTPTLALARRVIVEDGTAGRDLQGAAAFLALFPAVAVAVFAVARWAGWRG